MKKLSYFVAAMIVLWIFSMYMFMQSVTERDELYKSHLEDEYIIDGDTLKLIDYSAWGKTFTLSDGSKISSYIIIKEL